MNDEHHPELYGKGQINAKMTHLTDYPYSKSLCGRRITHHLGPTTTAFKYRVCKACKETRRFLENTACQT